MTTDEVLEENSTNQEEKTIKLAEFLDDWGDVLKAKVVESMDPVYNPKTEDEWDQKARTKLENLVRPAFDSQIKRGILPVARSLYKEDYRAATLVGEMGTGKSLCGLAIAYLDPKPRKRILIQCPGHLVKKWIREAQKTIPNAICINLNDASLASLIAHKGHRVKPKGIEVWVLGKERAKLHYQRKRQVVVRRGNESCPDCGQLIETDNSNSSFCSHCKARLWSADRDKFRRYAKAEFIKRFLPKGFWDLLVLDEVHELKGGGTAQGQAMSCLTTKAKKILSLTGTLMGGYSRDLYYLLWRMYPRLMKRDGFEYGRAMQFAERYGVIQRTYDSSDISESLNAASIGRKLGRCRTKESPGISPLLLPDLLLERSAFMRLTDISDALPAYDEIIVPVSMTDKQNEQYTQLAGDLITATQQALARGDMRLLGKMLQSLLAYPDGCRNAEEVTLEDRDGSVEVIATADPLDIDLLPKEEHLVKILQAEKQEGRNSAIFLEHTGTRDLIPTLVEKLKEVGLCPLVLRGDKVKPEQREDWLRIQMATGLYDCLICNPNLVKTGLDLLEFPTIIFFQTGYSVYTLRQASRRSWRIGQDQPVRVFFMAYAETMQDQALALMAQKMETSLAVEGELTDEGLAALSKSENSIVFELAKSLTGQQRPEGMTDAWAKYKEKSLVAGLSLDDDQTVEENTTTTIKTTTTLTSAAGKASVTYEYVVRGKVEIRTSGAVVFVDRNRFDLKDGDVIWHGRKVGFYDKKGFGEINNKPIRIYRPEQSDVYWLAELRSKAADVAEAA